MTLNRIVGLVVMATLVWTSIPISAEEREGVLVPRAVLAARQIDFGLVSGPITSNRQLTQLPSPVYPMPGQRTPLRTLAWAAMGVAAFMTYVRIAMPRR